MGGDLALLWHCLKLGKRKFLRVLYEPADAQAIVGKAASQHCLIFGSMREEVLVRPVMREMSFSVSSLVGSHRSASHLSPPIINRPVFCTRRACLMVKGVAQSQATMITAIATRKVGKPTQWELSTPANM